MEAQKNEQTTSREQIYIVGIGASAGGLEALQEFFTAMPSDTGAAFVVVQHLSPDDKSLMDELLSRCTSMPVMAAQDGQQVEANHVYLISPGKDLSIYKGRLYLKEQGGSPKINMAIDTFFRSLAADQGKHAIAVVLSGAGSDGTMGIRAIKETGGMIMVQNTETAKFDSMPQSSIATGLVDYVLAPSMMAEALVDYLKHPYIVQQEEYGADLSDLKDTVLSKILAELRSYIGIDFSSYKENTIMRRLERRVSVNRFTSLEDYLPYFMKTDEEKMILFKEFLIGVTSFFRDPEAFDCIAENVLPQIKPTNNTIRIWSVACSTGEEAYTLAMLLAEYMRRSKVNYEVKIFATDIDKDAIAVAAQGFYPDSVVSDVDTDLLRRYFTRCEGGYRISAEIRKMLIFSVHNVLHDPPFSKLDMVICRNLFIYLKPQVQQELLSTFYYALNPDGVLFMGSSESIGEMSDAFNVVNSRWKIYRQKSGYMPANTGGTSLRGLNRLMSYAGGLRTYSHDGIRAEKVLEQAFGAAIPPCVIVDEGDNIVHVENANQILTFRSGKFSTNLFSNLPNDIGLVVNGLMRKLKNEEIPSTSVLASGINKFPDQDLLITGYAFRVQQIRFFMFTFLAEKHDSDSLELVGTVLDGSSEMSRRVRELEQELQIAKESLQATVEELETANEELQSSNEELVASNEELQSTNEELQSVNEELYTVNSEYQVKINELVRLNNDLDNLLKNTDVGALYLDNNLCIRKITPRISEITNIREVDVGRPISHISLMDGYPEWLEDIVYVKDTLKPVDKEIDDTRGRYWLVRVRPYRSAYNSIEGIIMTFVEITALHRMESRVTEMAWMLNYQREIGSLLTWRYDISSQKAYVQIGEKPESQVKNFDDFWNSVHPDDLLHVKSALQECLNATQKKHSGMTYRAKTSSGYRWIYLTAATQDFNSEGKPLSLHGTQIDIDRISANDNPFTPEGWIYSDGPQPDVQLVFNSRGNVLRLSYGAEKMFGQSAEQLVGKSWNDLSWYLKDMDGQEVRANDYPFYVMKRTLRPVSDLHYQLATDGGVASMIMEGAPLLSPDGEFEGAVLSLKKMEIE